MQGNEVKWASTASLEEWFEPLDTHCWAGLVSIGDGRGTEKDLAAERCKVLLVVACRSGWIDCRASNVVRLIRLIERHDRIDTTSNGGIDIGNPIRGVIACVAPKHRNKLETRSLPIGCRTIVVCPADVGVVEERLRRDIGIDKTAFNA